MPDDLLGTLQPPPPASITQFPPLGQLGVGLAGMAAGMQGQANPILSQLQSQQESQFRQQAQMRHIQLAAQKQRMEQSKLALELGKDFLQVPGGRPYGAKVIVGALNQLRLLPPTLSPESLETLLSKQPVDERTLRAIAQDFTLFPEDSDAVIATRRSVEPKQVTDLRATWGNKTTRRLLFPRLAEFELKEQEFEERREDRQAERAQRWLQFQESQGLKRELAEMSVEMRRVMLGFQRDKAIDKDMAKRRDALTAVAALEGINNKLVRAIQKMAKTGALPDRPGLFADVAARVARSTELKNDPDVMFFLSFGSEQGIGLARTYQKDVGVRSIAPFQAMIHTMMNPGPLQSMLPILQQWQTELDIGKAAAFSPGGLIGPVEVQELQDFFTKLNQLNTQGIKVHGFQEIK